MSEERLSDEERQLVMTTLYKALLIATSPAQKAVLRDLVRKFEGVDKAVVVRS